MITEIGIIAGEIWHYLEQRGYVSLSELVRGIQRPKEQTLMSVGWLAREGHLLVKPVEGDFEISLRQRPFTPG